MGERLMSAGPYRSLKITEAPPNPLGLALRQDCVTAARGGNEGEVKLSHCVVRISAVIGASS
jgi:hypothetical protein